MKYFSLTMIGFASLLLDGISHASWDDVDPETAALIARIQAEEAGDLDPESARLIQRLQQEDARRPVARVINNNNNNNIDLATQAEIARIQAEEATMREIARIQAEEASAREIARLRAEDLGNNNNNNVDLASQAEIARIRAQEDRMNQDAALALRLANQGHLNAHIPQQPHVDRFNLYQVRQNLTPELNGQLDQMRDKIAEICATISGQNQAQAGRGRGQRGVFNPNDPQNVHKFNGMLKPFAGCLVELNRRLGLNPNSALENCMQRLRALRGVLGQDNTNLGEKELIQLTNYLKVHKIVEKETGMHPLHLLSCLVDYLEKSDNQAVDVRIFFDRLVENTLQKGGCYPGYVGRMMACNIVYILRLFRNVEISSK